MEYVINEYMKPVYKDGDLEDPYKKEIAKITRKKLISVDEYARYSFLNFSRGFWAVNFGQTEDLENDTTQAELQKKIDPEQIGKGVNYHDWLGLFQWCRCFVLTRVGYQRTALYNIATLRAYIREDNVLRLWGGDLQNIRDILQKDGVDVAKYPGLWDLPNGLGYGFYLGENMEHDYKIGSIQYAKKTIIAMINFLRLADVFLDMLGKTLNFPPDAYKANAKAWNEIILGIGGVFQNIETFLLRKPQKDTPPKELERLEGTKTFWRGIIDEIRAALDHEWTAQELKPLKDRLKKDPFAFYDVPTDVDFILEVFGAEKDY